MTPEEVPRRMTGTDNSQIDLKVLNDYLFIKNNQRKVERRDKRTENMKLSKEASKTVTTSLRDKLIQRGKEPNLGANFFAF